MAKLSVFQRHQKKIAIDTIKNPGKELLGGMTRLEALDFLASINYNASLKGNRKD